jgi:CheY-like chemotaxis protein
VSTACSPCLILLAEDKRADVRLVRCVLREDAVDCELGVMSDGDELVSFIRGYHPNPRLPSLDLLVLDFHLPKRGGKEILEYLGSSERCGPLPVIALTSSEASSGRHDPEINAAIYDFRKPSSLGEFMHLGIVVREGIKRPQSEPIEDSMDSAVSRRSL